MTAIYKALKGTGLPCAYARFKSPQELPFIVYIGNGQDHAAADNSYIWSENRYQIEYYFALKNEEHEAAIEKALLEAGYRYTKSEDIYIEDQDVFVIYYYV